MKDNPEYSKIRVIAVDWDLYRDDELVKDLRITGQGTLVMFNQGKEVERLVSQTAKDVIDAMFRSVL